MGFDDEFAAPLLRHPRIGAPDSPTNHATLWGWSAQEKTGLHPAPAAFNWQQWNNPLNSTEPWPGAIDSGAQPGAHDVKIYLSIADGVAATATTLFWEPNGTGTAYAGIVEALRESLPTIWWPPATRAELDIWGTGQSWLDSAPLTEDVVAKIDDVYNVLVVNGLTLGGSSSFLSRNFTALAAQGVPPATVAALIKAVSDLNAVVAQLQAGVPLTPDQSKELSDTLAGVQAIEAQLKAGLKAT